MHIDSQRLEVSSFDALMLPHVFTILIMNRYTSIRGHSLKLQKKMSGSILKASLIENLNDRHPINTFKGRLNRFCREDPFTCISVHIILIDSDTCSLLVNCPN